MYSQNDPAWKDTKIGFDTGPTDTIGNYGCYMTAIANVCNWAGHDQNPSQINDLCKQNGWLVSSDLIAKDDIPSTLCSNLQFVEKQVWHDATSMNYFADASSPDIAYIICIDASHAVGIQTHFVMVWATLGNGDLEIDDSWDGVRKPLSHYGNPSVIIQSATKFMKTAPAPPGPVAVPEPVPVPAPPVPYVPPAAPQPVVRSQKYEVLTQLRWYLSGSDAQFKRNPQGAIPAGSYYQFDTGDSTIQLGNDNMHALYWVNKGDNVAPVVIPVTVTKPSQVTVSGANDTSWRAGYKSFHSDNHSDTYELLQDVRMLDYSGQRTYVILTKGSKINSTGTFLKSGVTFYRVRANNDLAYDWWFGISMYNDDAQPNLKKSVASVEEVEQKLSDIWYFLRQDVRKWWDVKVLKKKGNL